MSKIIFWCCVSHSFSLMLALCISKTLRSYTDLVQLMTCFSKLSYTADISKAKTLPTALNKSQIYTLTLLSKYLRGNICWCSTYSKYGFCNQLRKAKICQFQCSRFICVVLNLYAMKKIHRYLVCMHFKSAKDKGSRQHFSSKE